MRAPVSVVIPCYNSPVAIFRRTLETLRRSTFGNFELVVVDDGSGDKEFLDIISECFAQARILRHLHNQGLSAARNTGVIQGEAPHFLQLDADDLVEPTFLEKALWALESHPEWAFCNAWHIAFGGRSYEWRLGFERGPEFLQANWTVPAAVIRRTADRAIGGHDETIRDGCEDWDYWLKMASHGYWGGTIPEFLIRYRIHDPPTCWPNRDDPVRLAQFRHNLRRKYPHLWRGGWPRLKPSPPSRLKDEIPDGFLSNPLPERNQKHILLILPWMTLGGADRFNLLLLEHLSRRGYTFTLCVTTDGPNPWLDKFTQYTRDFFILPNYLRLEDYPRFIRYLIQSRTIGVVLVSASQLGYGLLPFLRAHCPDVAFVDYVHMVDPTWRDGGYARASANSQPWLDLTLVSCRQAKDWMVAQGAEADRIEVCHINVDTGEWDPARFNRAALRRDLNLPDDQPVVLYAARLAPQKRPRVLAEVLLRLRKQGNSFSCLIAGDGPEYKWLERFIARNRLGNGARMMGAVAPEQMPELMAAADIFFLPSQDEGIALTLYEAMAMGLPVVAADVGGQNELVTPETGFMIPRGPAEADAYVSTLGRLIDSPALRASVGQAARARVTAHFNIRQMADRMTMLLIQAVSLSRTEPRPALSREAALAVAEQVIATARQEALAESLFAEHRSEWALGSRPAADTASRRLALTLKRRLLWPLYQWGLAHGMEWLVPLKNRLYRLVGQWRRGY